MTSIASPAETATHDAPHWASALYILLGASVWGIAWYPYRLLNGWGLGSLLASSMTARRRPSSRRWRCGGISTRSGGPG